ncbi:MAG TPA: N-methyl-L-tryptophan oxidase [Blastocatellia bacterium]|nr:N-methyl-L-tryptophan oxidase [Blastocatellia bacterium]
MLKSGAMRTYDVAIVGAGVMGAATACELAREGVAIALIDQSTVPNPRAASFDHSKVFRFAYPDAFYVRLAIDAQKRWRSIEEDTGAQLITQTGALLIGKRRPSFETACFDAMCAEGIQAKLLERDALARRFPQFNTDAFEYGVFDSSGAITRAETAVRALIDLARRRGVTVIEGARVSEIRSDGGSGVLLVSESTGEISCKRAMISSGPWSRKLVPQLADRLTTTRQEVVYFEPSPTSRLDFDPGRFPIFLELDGGFYGFPIHNAGAMKIANHHKGARVDPDSADEIVGELFIESCRGFFREFIPGLADARVRETRVCIYNNTPDDDFIIDWHPELEGVLVATGFSGHGFKFAPTIGRIAADLLASGHSRYEIDRFRLTRFDNTMR